MRADSGVATVPPVGANSVSQRSVHVWSITTFFILASVMGFLNACGYHSSHVDVKYAQLDYEQAPVYLHATIAPKLRFDQTISVDSGNIELNCFGERIDKRDFAVTLFGDDKGKKYGVLISYHGKNSNEKYGCPFATIDYDYIVRSFF